MYGQGQAMPPPKPMSQGALITLRVVFTVLPIISLSILAWVPMLWLALKRKRSLDWMLLGIEAGTSVVAFIFFGFSHDDNDVQANIGGTLLLICMFATGVYFLAADFRRTQVEQRQAWAVAPVYPHPYTTGVISGGPVGPGNFTQQGYPSGQQYPVVSPPAASGGTPQPAVPPKPLGAPATPPTPGPRINQVRAELDELSDYLRKEEGR